jgi:transcription initiation factor TFIIIB Brf1 subunit/transcription initiation factor TFIIB
MSINFFNSIEHLEPKCKNCNSKIEYGVTTEWDEERQTHVCIKCGAVVD